ncbi:MAG: Trans-aconitate 2-methyltransferase [Chlamydiae bacterium]|nr:Trans-aconitate 2-methyltransferase [Chlamydiota bacterium]
MFHKIISALLLQSVCLCAHAVHIWDGDDYHNNSDSQKRTAEFVIEKFSFNGDESVLDLGCGDGKISAKLSKLVPSGHTMGVDLSKNMIDFAQKNFPSNQFNNLSFSTGNACELDFENRFNVIFSFTALQWAQDHQKVLLGMHRALKANGTIAITMPMGLPLTVQQALEEMTAKDQWRRFFTKDFSTGFNFVSLEQYQEILDKSGFKTNLIEKIAQKDFFESKEHLSKFMSQWLPYLRPIPNDLKAAFMSELLDRYIELEGIEAGDSVYFCPNHLTVIAHKV